MRHITIGLQKVSDQGIVKRPCDLEGLEQYLMLSGKKDGITYFIKVVQEILAEADIDETAAWKQAKINLYRNTRIESLDQVLSEMNGITYDTCSPLYIISNPHRNRGAAAIMNRKAISAFARRFKTNMLYVLPSSIHEMILMPYNTEFTLDVLSAMVREINEKQVAPEERLTDRAYILSV